MSQNGPFGIDPEEFDRVFREAGDGLRDAIDRLGKGAGWATLLDQYGAASPAEFFAVATECFFDAPRAMQREYPELYELFQDYYHQDPAAWQPFEE